MLKINYDTIKKNFRNQIKLPIVIKYFLLTLPYIKK